MRYSSVSCNKREKNKALEAVAIMMQGKVVELDSTIAIDAAMISHDLKIPMADSIMLATARMHQAILWSQDSDFATTPDVKYIKK